MVRRVGAAPRRRSRWRSRRKTRLPLTGAASHPAAPSRPAALRRHAFSAHAPRRRGRSRSEGPPCPRRQRDHVGAGQRSAGCGVPGSDPVRAMQHHLETAPRAAPTRRTMRPCHRAPRHAPVSPIGALMAAGGAMATADGAGTAADEAIAVSFVCGASTIRTPRVSPKGNVALKIAVRRADRNRVLDADPKS